MKEHKPGYPVTCACGEMLHTSKMVKFHTCAKRVKKASTPQPDEA